MAPPEPDKSKEGDGKEPRRVGALVSREPEVLDTQEIDELVSLSRDPQETIRLIAHIIFRRPQHLDSGEIDNLDRLKRDHPEIYTDIYAAPRQVRDSQIALQFDDSRSEHAEIKRGQVFGFVLALIVAIGSSVALIRGDTVGVAGVIVGLGGIGAAFLPGDYAGQRRKLRTEAELASNDGAAGA